MIYISTSCVKHRKIKDSVEELALNGFKNIELSGGTEYYENFERDLIELKGEYNLNYRCHNYFPPPKKPFVTLPPTPGPTGFFRCPGDPSAARPLGCDHPGG